jgi:hypothetical protein
MRRTRQQEPRAQAVTVKLSITEKAAVQSAAARRQLSVGAYIADTALAAAEGRTVQVGDTEREMLRELIRVGNLLSICRTQLADAVERLEATGVPGPDLGPAAACCERAGTRADDVAIRVSRLLRRSARLRPAGPSGSASAVRLGSPFAYLGAPWREAADVRGRESNPELSKRRRTGCRPVYA